MYEHENGNRIGRGAVARTLGAPADEDDARARARRALQDAYDWRDDEPDDTHAPASASASAGNPRGAESAARAEARRIRREVVRSISRTVGV